MKTKLSRMGLIATIILIPLLLLSCKPKQYVENLKDPIRLPEIRKNYPDIARFMAGLPVAKESTLYPITQKEVYSTYVNDINKKWTNFKQTNIDKMQQWQQINMPKNSKSTIFYPFSGPDILHAMTFYPNGTDILMFGLETEGDIPDPASIPEAMAIAKLQSIPNALGFILTNSFFVTKDMIKDIGSTPYSGITGIMMFFLAKSGYTVLDVKKIVIEKGILKEQIITKKDRKTDPSLIPGIEIIFSNGKDDLRRVRYFSLDISDTSKQVDSFISYANTYPETSTIAKSASYLMHISSFSKIRDFTLEKSRYILQDDSGIAYRFFKPDKWHMTYYGKYHMPIRVFKGHYQKKLAMLINQHSSGLLPFRYGYGYQYRDITYHLMLAEKKMQMPQVEKK